MLEKTLQGPLDCKVSNQSILKEINSEYSSEGLMLKLKLQYFGHLMQRANQLKNTLMLEKIVGRRRREQQRKRWLDGIIDSMDMHLSKLLGDSEGQGSLACCIPWGCKESDMTEQLNNNKSPVALTSDHSYTEQSKSQNSLPQNLFGC